MRTWRRSGAGAKDAPPLWLLPVLALLVGWGAGCEGPQAPQAPGGGRELALDYAVFVDAIEPILQERGCSASACHGNQGSGELLLTGGLNPEADFTAVGGHVTPWEASASPLLRKPLAQAAGGDVHGGGDVFLDTSDADYRTLLQWLSAGSTP
ncbi:MAG: hypothetical protein JSW67_05280 [Candidatus Latescibacterota bacterium]|nr:MAG: hypothetical protein JSW67_05280 [Candidatus Latescibacterota bacterium]